MASADEIRQKAIADAENQAVQIYIAAVGAPHPHRLTHPSTKFTVNKRKEFLQHYAKTLSIPKSAAAVGVAFSAAYALKKRDPQFRAAIESVEMIYLEEMKSVGCKLAVSPTREGFNDRKFFLERHPLTRKDYGQRLDVEANIKQELGVSDSLARLLDTLSKFQSSSAPRQVTVSKDYEIL